jgi:hypothetical protein
MKKVSLFQITLIVCMLSLGAPTLAQSSKQPFLNKKSLIDSGSGATEADRVTLENLKTTNARMYNHFTRNFGNATDIRVANIGKQQLITCSVDGGQNRIRYQKNGRWQSTIRTYENSLLPEDVREFINDSYPKYSIFGAVIEVSAGGNTALLVLIENKNSWKRIRVVNGEMDVYEEYAKR